MSDSTLMLTPKEVADILGVHQKTVHLWLRSGKLHGVKISYRAWRIPKDSLDFFIESNSNRLSKQVTNTPTRNNQEQKETNQATLIQDKKDEQPTSQLKMKYYIRDIMGEQSPNENK
ncbi:helix-turn-helix domain-containing protein [Methanoregula sp.]|uniref:helix-turn-helix domain-containing protein n=1 Tax=Methanoregula sp. TaxID=2052170 RepID=UPI0035613FE2